MQAAFLEALKSHRKGGIPIGSVLVKNNRIIGRGHNQRVQRQNPILHAEIDCLQNAGRIENYRGTTLYSTLMPCYLCAGAVVQFGIQNVVAGESKSFSGAKKFMQSHHVKVIDLDLDECKSLMNEFIQKNPHLWSEDIGRH